MRSAKTTRAGWHSIVLSLAQYTQALRNACQEAKTKRCRSCRTVHEKGPAEPPPARDEQVVLKASVCVCVCVCVGGACMR